MSCLNCTRACEIPKCTTTLSVGTIALLNTAVKVFIEHRARNKRVYVDVTTDGSGQVDLPMAQPDPDFWVPGFDYQLWVVADSSSDIYDLETITLTDTSTVTCFKFEIGELLDQDFDPAALSTVELVTSVT